MRYGSVCSGIEAASQAWHPLGWSPVFFSEVDKFPSAVLAHHYGSNMPDEAISGNGVPNYGDMTKFEGWPDHAIDVLVGGTPAKIIPWRDFALAWLAIEDHSPLPSFKLLRDTAPNGSFGKTSLASSQATTDATLQSFWATSRERKSLFPSMDGKTADLLPESKTHMALPMLCVTLNTSEWTGLDGLSLSDDGVCSLSDVLETGDVPLRYYLSQKACKGILRRAEVRGKSLPEQLTRALEGVADRE